MNLHAHFDWRRIFFVEYVCMFFLKTQPDGRIAPLFVARFLLSVVSSTVAIYSAAVVSGIYCILVGVVCQQARHTILREGMP